MLTLFSHVFYCKDSNEHSEWRCPFKSDVYQTKTHEYVPEFGAI